MVFDLWLKVLMEVIQFLVMIKRYPMKCLFGHLLSWVHLEELFVSSNVEVFGMK